MGEADAYAVLVLAAGASRRMGEPKQLLPIEGEALLRRVVQAAVTASIGGVWVVLGANAARIRPALDGLPATLLMNEAWAEGMGSSLRCGVAALPSSAPALRGALVVLGDMPAVSAEHLRALARVHRESGKSIVASRQAGKLCPPVLFDCLHFPALLALRGDVGARSLLQGNPEQIAPVDTDALADLDTPADYQAFLRARR